MSRRTKPKREITVSDLGPLIQRERGDLLVVDAPDPERPQATPVRRAMRSPHYDRLWRKGDLTDEQREACDAYAILTERRDGAHWVNGERVGGGTHPAFQGHPTMTQVQASARLTTAHRVVGNAAAALLGKFVVANQPIEEIARQQKERAEVTKGRVLAAIARLSEHWGMA